MDTKSKKSKWISSLVCIGLVLVITAAAMAAIPAMCRRAEKFQEDLYENWRFEQGMESAIWGAYQELHISPNEDWANQWDLYVPEFSKTKSTLQAWENQGWVPLKNKTKTPWAPPHDRLLQACHRISEELNMNLEGRIRDFSYYMENLAYQAQDTKNSKSISNTQDDLDSIFKGELRDRYQYAVVMEFDAQGGMTVKDIWPSGKKTEKIAKSLQTMHQNELRERQKKVEYAIQDVAELSSYADTEDTPYSMHELQGMESEEEVVYPKVEVDDQTDMELEPTPMPEQDWSEAQQELTKSVAQGPAKEIAQTISNFKLQGPRNMRLVLAIPTDLEYRDLFWRAKLDSQSSALGESGVVLLYCGMLAAAVLAGLVLGLVRRWNIGNGRLMNALPVEGLALAVISGSVLVMDSQLVVVPFMPFLWPECVLPLAKQWMLPIEAVKLLAQAVGIAGWALSAALVFLCALSLSKLFLVGPWAWLKSRSWCVRILVWLAGGCKRLWLQVTQIRLETPGSKAVLGFVLVNLGVMALACLGWFFGIIAAVIYGVFLYVYLAKKHKQTRQSYQIVLGIAEQMAQGRLDAATEENAGVFEPLKQELTKVQSGFRKAVDAEVRSRSMKTELITNVSHDLKTPLTAIITYVDLLKKPELTPEEQRSYVDTLDRKSQRLKQLIEDLFEVSRAASRELTARLEPLDLCALLQQVRFELNDKLDGCGVDFRWELPEEKVPVLLDGQRTCRVFENLLVNITKYALPGTRAYVVLTHDDREVEISFKNISAAELDVKNHDLTDRFVRGDASRSTEGSGLGLAIAKSFVELQNGRFEIQVDGDLFKAVIHWPMGGSLQELIQDQEVENEPPKEIETIDTAEN